MKSFKTITAAIALIAMLSACSDRDNTPIDGPDLPEVPEVPEVPGDTRTALSITADITDATTDAPAATRSAAESTALWHPGDAIGIIMLNADTATPTDGKTNYRYHTTTGTATFIPTDKANTAYFPTAGAKVDLIAYYPHTDALDDFLIPINVTDQSTPAAIDLMTAPRTTGHSSATPEVAITFAHRLCKLVLNLKTDDSTAHINLAGATATITGTPATAQWNLLTETLQPTTTTEVATITLAITPTGNLATAILIPTAAGAGKTVTLTTADGKAYTATIDATLPLAAGTVSTFALTLKRDEAQIDYLTIHNVSIDQWTTITGTGNIEIQ